jgi:hypothetical protein
MAFGYLPYPYMDIRPVTSADGTQASPGSDSLPLWVWIVGAAAVVGVIVLLMVASRRREDRVA